MRIGTCLATRIGLVVGVVTLAAAPSRAVSFSFVVDEGGESRSFTAAELGCVPTSATRTDCSQTGLVVDGLDNVPDFSFNIGAQCAPFCASSMIGLRSCLSPSAMSTSAVMNIGTMKAWKRLSASAGRRPSKAWPPS